MTISPGLRFLRPYLCKDLAVSQKHAYLRFFSSTRCLGKKAYQKIDSYGHDVSKGGGEALKRNTNDRITKLESANALKWPRIQNDVNGLTLTEYNEKYKRLQAGAKLSDETVLIRGMDWLEIVSCTVLIVHREVNVLSNRWWQADILGHISRWIYGSRYLQSR